MTQMEISADCADYADDFMGSMIEAFHDNYGTVTQATSMSGPRR